MAGDGDGDGDGAAQMNSYVKVETVDRSKANVQLRLDQRMYREASVSGFSHLDQEVTFYTQVAALLQPTDVVLDFGAGRGEWHEDDPCLFRRRIQNFKGRCRHVDGCDFDPVVLTNETLDAAAILEPGQPLPYEDNRFDLVISRYVFEHVADPVFFARELLRITRPGGWICAITPNKWGYVALMSRMVPNSLHRAALKFIQPHRKAEDVFRTEYKLNTPKAVKRYFGQQADVYWYRSSAVPSYHFGSAFLYAVQRFIHRFLPPPLDKGLHLFICKRSA